MICGVCGKEMQFHSLMVVYCFDCGTYKILRNGEWVDCGISPLESLWPILLVDIAIEERYKEYLGKQKSTEAV